MFDSSYFKLHMSQDSEIASTDLQEPAATKKMMNMFIGRSCGNLYSAHTAYQADLEMAAELAKAAMACQGVGQNKEIGELMRELADRMHGVEDIVFAQCQPMIRTLATCSVMQTLFKKRESHESQTALAMKCLAGLTKKKMLLESTLPNAKLYAEFLTLLPPAESAAAAAHLPSPAAAVPGPSAPTGA